MNKVFARDQAGSVGSSQELEARIAALEQFQRETISEARIIEFSNAELKELRDQYRRIRQFFSDDLIQRLQEAGERKDDLAEFVRLQEEMQDMFDLDDFRHINDRLLQLAASFEGFAVAKRIAKELRELGGMRSGLSATESSKAISRVEQAAPKCRCASKMTLRKGNDWFWGCHRFPRCRGTKELSDEHASLLNISQV